LAKQGFNIVLVARNKGKLINVEKEVRQNRVDVDTRIVIADFK